MIRRSPYLCSGQKRKEDRSDSHWNWRRLRAARACVSVDWINVSTRRSSSGGGVGGHDML